MTTLLPPEDDGKKDKFNFPLFGDDYSNVELSLEARFDIANFNLAVDSMGLEQAREVAKMLKLYNSQMKKHYEVLIKKKWGLE